MSKKDKVNLMWFVIIVTIIVIACFKNEIVDFIKTVGFFEIDNTAMAAGTIEATTSPSGAEATIETETTTETTEDDGILKYLSEEEETDLNIQVCVKNEKASDWQEEAHILNNIQVEVFGNRDFEIILGDSVLKDTYDGYDAYAGIMKNTKVITTFMEQFEGNLKITTVEEEKNMPGIFMVTAKETMITYIFTPKNTTTQATTTALPETTIVETEVATTVETTKETEITSTTAQITAAIATTNVAEVQTTQVPVPTTVQETTLEAATEAQILEAQKTNVSVLGGLLSVQTDLTQVATTPALTEAPATETLVPVPVMEAMTTQVSTQPQTQTEASTEFTKPALPETIAATTATAGNPIAQAIADAQTAEETEGALGADTLKPDAKNKWQNAMEELK